MFQRLPRLFSFAKDKDANEISELYNIPLTVQAYQEYNQLQLLMVQLNLSMEDNDVWTYVWGNGKYSSQKYYNPYFQHLQQPHSYVWIWGSKCTMKQKVFAWLLISDRLNTKNMLKRRHITIQGNHGCV